MKKYFWIILLISFFGFSFAQETNNSWTTIENYLIPGEMKVINQDFNTDNMVDIQNIQARFCNDDKLTKDVKLDMRPWQREEICVILINQWTKPMPLLFWFTEGTIDDNWIPHCQSDMTNKNEFSKKILQNSITWIIIPASWNIVQKFTYISSKSASWNMLGCFGYKIDKEVVKDTGALFLITPRKVGYIYVHMTWSVYQFWRIDSIKDTYINNKSIILKIIIAILSIRIVITLFQTGKKKEKHHTKK